MSETIMQETPMQVMLTWTGKVKPSTDGGYVGFMQEIPMAAQGDTEEEVLAKLSVCLQEYINHESLAAVPRSMIKM